MTEPSKAAHHAACLFGGALFSAGIASAQPTFTPQTIGNSAYIAEDLFPVDLDGDGDVDLVGATTAGGSGVKIPWFENNGANPPSFTQRTVYAGGGYVRSIFPADIDGDGDIDVFSHINQTVHWHRQNPDRSFTSFAISNVADWGPFTIQQVFATDADNDGDLDVAVAAGDDNIAAWFENRLADGDGGPDGFFSFGVGFGFGANMRDVFCIDMDGDDITDAVTASDEGIKVHTRISGGIPPTTVIDPAPAQTVYVSDVDLDGDLDIVGIVEDDDVAPLVVRLYRNAPSGFTALNLALASTATDILAVDLDSDLDDDVAYSHTSLGPTNWVEQGDFSDSLGSDDTFSYGSIPSGGKSLAAADMDGDGDTDLVRAAGGVFQVLFNNGEPPSLRFTRNVSRATVHETFVAAVQNANPNDLLAINSATLDEITNIVLSGPPALLPDSTLDIRTVGDFSRNSGSLFAYNNSFSSGIPRSIQVGPTTIPISNRDFSMTLGGFVEVQGDSIFSAGTTIDTPHGSTFFVPPNGNAWLTGPSAVTLSGATFIDPQGTIQTYGGPLTLADAPQAATSIQGSGQLITLDTIINNQPVLLAGGTLRAGNGITNNATITSHGGTVRVGGMFFPGFGTFISTGTYTGWGVIDANMTNDGNAVILANTQITGDLTNNSTTTIQSGTLTILGALTDNGTITGDLAAPRPAGRGSDSSGLFVGGDYAAGPTAQLRFPTGGTVAIAGTADIGIDRTAQFDLAAATLKLNGLGNSQPQRLEAMSTDIGPDAAALERTTEGNFPLGTLRVGPTATTVVIFDGRDNDRAGSSTPEAIYTSNLIIDAGANLITNGHKVYYQSLTIDGTVDDPANLVQIAEPCPADLAAPFGTLDIDDVLTFLLFFDRGSLQADLVPTGTLDIDDVLFFLLTFNSGCGS